MEIHPIRNDDDHAAAIKEIEKLWGAAPGTEAGDKLDILATLVEKYEDSRWPNVDVSDPIDLLNYAIEELGPFASRTRRSAWLSLARIRAIEPATSLDGRDDSQDQRSVEDSGRSSGGLRVSVLGEPPRATALLVILCGASAVSAPRVPLNYFPSEPSRSS
jgi:hypothetical protein